MKYLLGIDFGGGASKACLIDQTGKAVATNTVEYRTHYPQSGYAEQNPADWYSAAKASIAEVLKTVSAKDIAAVAFDAATHTAVLCDGDFRVLRPAIYWTDTRCQKQVAFLRENHLALIKEQALHAPDTIWTLPQLMWVRENEPHIWEKTRKILFAKDYVRRLLTGDFVTDYVEAEGSMLFDCNTLSWSKDLLGILGIEADMLPETVSPTDIAGRVTASAARETGLSEGTPVLCGTTDTAAEILAAGAVTKGDMTVKLATAGRICVITDKPYPDQNLVNYSHAAAKGLWYPGTATKSCAASYRWYRDAFGGEYGELDRGAQETEVGCGGLMFHPYLNGELTPYADPKLCASFIGIRAGHTKAHFTRAVLEGVALSLLDCKKALEKIGVPHEDGAVIIGGGAKSPLWRQIVSDCLGIGLTRKENSDSSFGTALLAGMAAGLIGDVKNISPIVGETSPNPENTEKYAALFDKYKAVHDALAPIYQKL